jgi:geranylgeranyl pyrophosphate synthase
MADAYLDLNDWIDLLDLRDAITRVTDGLVSPDAARAVVNERRTAYPNVMGDYVRAFQSVDDYLDLIDNAIDDQNYMLRQFASAVGDAGVVFTWNSSRLLDDNTRAEIRRIEAYLEEQAVLAERAAEEAAAAIAELQSQLAALEELRAALEAEAEALESAIAATEEALGEAEYGE